MLFDEALGVLPCQEGHRVILVLAQRQNVLRRAAVPWPPACVIDLISHDKYPRPRNAINMFSRD